MVRLLTGVWRAPPELLAAGRRVSAAVPAVLASADHLSGRSSVWDVVGIPGTGKSTLLAAAQAELASAGARAVSITMEVPADSYERRRAGSDDPLVIELARTQLCMDVARAVGEKLSDVENLRTQQHMYSPTRTSSRRLTPTPRVGRT